MKKSTRLFFYVPLILMLAGLMILLSTSHAIASTLSSENMRSPLLASAVSTHGNINFTDRTEELFQYVCTYCHNSHGGTGNLATIRNSYVIVNMSPFAISGPIVFTARTGTNSFDDGVSAPTSRICVTCHINNSRYGSATAMSHTGGYGHVSGDYTGQDCATCHPHDADGDPATADGFMPLSAACDRCHGAPPATGSHPTHSNPATLPTVYGETGVRSTSTTYDFACGECHPTDVSRHMNGTVDVVLTSTSAPVGSIKAKNPASASYDTLTKTCSDSYCHSGERVAPTGTVNWPLLDGTGTPIIDSHNNPTYASYTSSTFREYAAPVWGSSLPDNGGPEGICDSCHQFPLTTSFRDGVMGGAVDSHQWIGPDPYWGGTWGSLHAYSYMAAPIPCRTCHYQTVTTQDALTNVQRYVTNSFGDNITVFGALPIADRTFHVNGNADVAFDTVNSVGFYSSSGLIQMPVTGTYFPAQKSCGNVSCHGYNLPALIGKNIGGQNYVTWGSPYHIYESPTWEGCEFCHRPGGYSGKQYPVLAACNTCHPAMASVQKTSPFSISSIFNVSYVSRKSASSLPASHPSGACTNCHTPHMPDAAANPRLWTIDKIAPDTQVDLHPANPTSNANAIFTFSSADTTAVFECSLDGAAFSPCNSGQLYSELSDGSHTFEVRAKDAAGNMDATPATYIWTIDIVAPDTEINSSPANPSYASGAIFTFSSADTTATFECSLDSGSFSACTSPKTYSGLSQDAHIFQVRAKDAAGNVDATSASHTWMIATAIANYTSIDANDGWLLESAEFSNKASTRSTSGFLRVGDDAKNKQYRSVLHFNTNSLPNKAIIKKVTLQIRKAGTTGVDPFTTHGNLVADMKKGFFGSSVLLDLIDFQVAGTPIHTAGRFFMNTPNDWYQLTLNPANFKYVNLLGITQFRLRFEKDDNNNRISDFISFYSGDSVMDKPLLTIEYYMP